MDSSKVLKKLILDKETLIMPDAYDPISAVLIENAGFKAVQCSGFSFSLAAAYFDESEVSLDDNIEWTKRIVDKVSVPVMADAEDGYGGPEEVAETIRRFINIGVAGINLEDQIVGAEYPLKILDAKMMGDKIKMAKKISELEGNPDLVINGRTDALRSLKDKDEALSLAIDRANQYLGYGADLVFIPYVSTLDEVEIIMEEVKGPVSIAAGMPYNIENFSLADLKEMGVNRVSLPTLLILASLGGIKKSLNYLKNDEMTRLVKEKVLIPFEDIHNMN